MKIFIIGWFGAGNVGDEAILLSMLTEIGKMRIFLETNPRAFVIADSPSERGVSR